MKIELDNITVFTALSIIVTKFQINILLTWNLELREK